jgi:hypothetical protein
VILVHREWGDPLTDIFCPAAVSGLASNGNMTAGPLFKIPEVKDEKYNAGRGPVDAVLADFNGDQIPEVITANSGQDDLTYFPGMGGGSLGLGFTPSLIKFTPRAIAALNWDAAADYPNNTLDLAVLTENPFNVYIFYGHQTTEGVVWKVAEESEFYRENQTYPGNDPVDILARDANQDGLEDILVLNRGSNSVFVFTSTGLEKRPPQVQEGNHPFAIPTGNGPTQFSRADLNGDECPDLAVLNEGARSVTLLINGKCQ